MVPPKLFNSKGEVMWHIVKPVIGVLLILGSLNGAKEMIMGDDTVNRDMEATATIESLTVNTLRVTRLAKKHDHYISYSFRAHDGELYSKSYSISPAEFTSLREGQKLPVLYHKNNPSINAIPSLRAYNSVAEMQAISPAGNPMLRGILLVVFSALGGFLVWSGLSGYLPQSGGTAIPNANLASRVNTVSTANAGRPAGFGKR